MKHKLIMENWKQYLTESAFSGNGPLAQPAAHRDDDSPPKLPDAHQGEEGRMHRTQLAQMISDATMLLDMFDDTTDLPEWLEVKITKASDYIRSATSYLAGEKSRDQGRLSGDEEGDEWTSDDEANLRATDPEYAEDAEYQRRRQASHREIDRRGPRPF